MATISQPILAWVSTILASTGVNQSSNLTATVHVTQGWEVQIPFRAQFSNVSNDPIVSIYPSSDGGANFDTQAMIQFAIPNVNSGTRISQFSVRIPTGQYAIQITSSGPNSQSFQILTAQVITAINNV